MNTLASNFSSRDAAQPQPDLGDALLLREVRWSFEMSRLAQAGWRTKRVDAEEVQPAFSSTFVLCIFEVTRVLAAFWCAGEC